MGFAKTFADLASRVLAGNGRDHVLTTVAGEVKKHVWVPVLDAHSPEERRRTRMLVRVNRLLGVLLLGSVLLAVAESAEQKEKNAGVPYRWTSGADWQMDEELANTWWISRQKDMLADPLKREELVFTKDIDLPDAPREASLRISAEGTYTLWINDREVGSDDQVCTLDQYDVRPFLKKGTNRFRVKTQAKRWGAGLFVSGEATLPNGETVRIRSDRSWTAAKEDESDTAGPAGEVVRGINGGFWNNVGRLMAMPESYYRLNTGVETPGIAWAKPYAGEKVKVLALTARGGQRDFIELTRRTDLDVSIVFSDLDSRNYEAIYQDKYSTAPFFPLLKGMFYDDAKARVENALAGTWDVIILADIGGRGGAGKEKLFYEVVADRLKTLVKNGTGLIYRQRAIPPQPLPLAEGQKKAGTDDSYEQALTSEPIADQPGFLATGMPFGRLPGFHLREQDQEKRYENVASLFQFGKGRVMRLNARWIGALANRNADNNDLHYQYYMAFAIKSVLWAAGKEPAVQLRDFPATLSRTPADPVQALQFSLAGVPRGCKATLDVRSPEKLARVPAAPITSQGLRRGVLPLRPLGATSQEVRAGPETKVSLPLPVLPAGEYFLDVTIEQNGKKANWATAHLTVERPVAIAELKLSKPHIDVAEGKLDKIGAEAVLNAGARGGMRVRFQLLDNYDRLLAEQEVPVREGAEVAVAAFPVKGFTTTLGRVRAELLDGERVESVKVARFTAIRRDWDHYVFVGWSRGTASHQDVVYSRVLAGLGFEASRHHQLKLDDLEAVDKVSLPPYPFPRYGHEKINYGEMLKESVETASKIAESQLPFDPIAFNTGDEFYYRGGEEKPSRIQAYREYLEEKYGAIKSLNDAWDSHYTSFDQIYPILPAAKAERLKDQGNFVKQEEYLETAHTTRNYARYVDQWLDNYRAYMNAAEVAREGIKRVYPQARVGMDCPMWPHSTSGHDWYRFMQNFEYLAPYGRGGEIIPEKQARSYAKPGQFLGLTYGGYLYMAYDRREELTDVAWQRWRLWNGFLDGFNSMWWYNLVPGAHEGNLAPGYEPYPSLLAATDAIASINRGYYTLFNPLSRDYGPIAMHDSVPSRIACGVLPEGGGGYGHNFNMHVFMNILQHQCGRQYTLVDYRQVLQGELDKYRVLTMPKSVVVGAEEAKALKAWLKKGGTIIADWRPGVFDGSGRWNGDGTVTSLFGLSYGKELGCTELSGKLEGTLLARELAIEPAWSFPADPAVKLSGAKALCEIDGVPLVTVNEVGEGRAICLNIPFTYFAGYNTPDCLYAYWGDEAHNKLIAGILNHVLETLGVERALEVESADGAWPFRLDVASYADGAAQYIGLTRKVDRQPASRITLHPKQAGHVYDMFSGEYLGHKEMLEIDIPKFLVKLFSVLPYQVAGLECALAQGPVRVGQQISGTVTVQTGDARPVRHMIHVETIRPDGQAVRYLARNLETKQGKAEFSLPLALNESTGEWKLEFTDVATQAKKQISLRVE